MNGKRLLGALGASVLVGMLGTLAACSSSGDQGKADAAETLGRANVAITLHDASGAAVGEGAGVLIGPRIVLTSAHLVAGTAKWTIRTTDGKVVTGVRGVTKDWRAYDSMKSHPRRTDVAVIYLDKAIDLPAYPKVARERAALGKEALRVRRTQTGFATVAAKLGRFRSFPNAYVTDIPTNETLSTGGAVLNENFEIVGLVTGRGLSSGKLHVARLERSLAWLSPKIACGGGSKVALATALGTKTYGTPPPPKPDCEKDGGTSTTSSSSSSSSGGGGTPEATSSSSGSSSGGSGAPSGSSSGGAGDGENNPLSCDDGGGLCSGDCTNLPSASTGSSDSPAGGGSGITSPDDDGAAPGSPSVSILYPPDDGSDGTSTGAGGSDSPTASSSGGGSGSGPADQCTGADDTPEVCPPEPSGCVGANCGGGAPDDLIDYGKVVTSPSASGSINLR
jgi:hypothetical protein